jgi:hypothetical protein
MAGNERLIQQDWSAGMFRSVAPELIPDSGAYDIVNGLLSIDGSIFRRGGTSWYTPNVGFGTRVTLLWDGYLTNGGKTTVAGDKDFYGEIPQGGGDPFGTFGSGTGNTQPTRGVGYNGVLYLPNGHTYDGTTYTTMGTAVAIQPFYAVVSDRLLAAGGNRVYFSAIGDPTTWDPTDYWDMPDGCKIIGLQGLRDACLVFTTVGVFAISGLTQNLTDADGNTQQRLDRYSQEIVLWSDASIAAWAGGLVVASNDGVYIIHLGVASEAPQQFERISDPVSSLYREYVAAGYRAGGAVVHQGHYFLPILAPDFTVDVLVCRLDTQGRPWTRLSGYGARASVFAETLDQITQQPTLLAGALNGKVMRCSYFTPSSTTQLDADGSNYSWGLTTKAYVTGRYVKNTVTKLRASYKLEDAAASGPTITASMASAARPAEGPATKWGQFKWGAANWSSSGTEVQTLQPLQGSAPRDLDGTHPYTWWVRRKTRLAQFQLSSSAQTNSLSLRALEVFVRSDGRI